MDNYGVILAELQEAQKVLNDFLSENQNLAQIEKAAETMVSTIKNGGKILSCGNGGSHCDAMHFAEEMTGRYRDSRKPLPAFAISDVSHISCVANDYGYEHIFSRYVEASGKKGDVLLGISTSGNSQNIVNAAILARKLGMSVIALTGKNGGLLGKESDIEIRVPHFGYADRIQEVHIKVIHIFMHLIEKGLGLS